MELSPDVDFDEQVGDFLRRGDRLWIAPPRTPLPEMDAEPGPPWFYVGKMPEGYDPHPQTPWRGQPIYGPPVVPGCVCGCNNGPVVSG